MYALETMDENKSTSEDEVCEKEVCVFLPWYMSGCVCVDVLIYGHMRQYMGDSIVYDTVTDFLFFPS